MSAPTEPEEVAVGVADIAELLGMKSLQTVRNLAANGDIPAFKVGRDWRFFKSKVIAHLEKPVDTWAAPERATRARKKAAA